ncbi:MAG: MFS transporter [bacterium]
MLEDSTVVEYFRQIQGNLRRNFAVFSVTELFWGIGASFITTETILAAFLLNLEVSKTVIGLLPALTVFGFTWPQLIAAYYTEHLRSKKSALILFHIPPCASWLLVALNAFLVVPRNTRLGTLFFFISYGIYVFGLGFCIPLWVAIIGKLITPERRGRLFGTVFTVGGLGGFGGAILATKVLMREDVSFHLRFGFCFLVAFFLLSLAVAGFLFLREPSQPGNESKRRVAEYITVLRRILGGNRNFRMYLLGRAVLSFGRMGTAFYAVYAIERIDLPVSIVGVFTVVLLSTQSSTSFFWSYVGDKRGFKVVLLASSVALLTANGTALLASSAFTFYLIFVALGMHIATDFVSHNNFILELCPGDDKTTYVGLSSTLLSPFLGFTPLLGGRLIDSFSFPLTFGLAAAASLCGLLILALAVKEPRKSDIL